MPSPLFERFCEIVLVRHGETDWNKTRRIQGTLDIPLNDKGREQVKETGQIIRKLIEETPGCFPIRTDEFVPGNNRISATKFYTSPLKRASESASILAECVGYPINAIEVYEDIKEWNAGEVQGILFPELEQKCPKAWQSWRIKRDPHYTFNGGESFAQRHERVHNAIQMIADKNLGKRVVVVCHSGVIDEVFRLAKHVPLRNFTKIPKLNAGTYILMVETSGPPQQTVQGENEYKPKWKILRWGHQRIPDRKSSIQFDYHIAGEFDPFSTEYA